MFFQLTYISESISNTTSASISEILEKSRINNKIADITGCLIHYNNKFVQLLEGNEASIKLLIEKIKNDDRHKNVEIIATSPSEVRSFGEWGMAYYPMDELNTNEQELMQFKNNMKLLIDVSTPKTFTESIFWKEIKTNLGV